MTALASGFGAIWALDLFGDRLLRIDPVTNPVQREIPVHAMPTGLAVGHGFVWVASQLTRPLAGIDPRTGAVSEARPVRPRRALAGRSRGRAGRRVGHQRRRQRSEPPRSGEDAAHRTPAGHRCPHVSFATGQSVWVGRAFSSSLLRLGRGRPVTIPAGGRRDGYGPRLTAGHWLWVTRAEEAHSDRSRERQSRRAAPPAEE